METSAVEDKAEEEAFTEPVAAETEESTPASLIHSTI